MRTIIDEKIDDNLDLPEAVIDLARRKTIGTLGMIGLLGGGGLVGCGGGDGSNSSSSSINSSAGPSSSSFSSTSSLGAQSSASERASSKMASSKMASSKMASSKAASSAATSSTASSAASCKVIPTETIGPFPLSTLLDSSKVMRENIAEDKTGVPLKLRLKLVDVNNSCKPVSGYVYIWHCDKDGNYSGYLDGGNDQRGKTFCRGVQFTDSNGAANFTTIYPGWYDGRVTHMHFQVFLNTVSGTAKATTVSQFAFPDAINTAVYNTRLYTNGQNTSVEKNTDDFAFKDGITLQLTSVTGTAEAGYTAELEIGLDI
jgi:protocatechuate 3,4-dioxygenase beta subunit